MTHVNKLTLVNMAVILVAAIAVFCTIIIGVILVANKGANILLVLPNALAVGYGVYAFVKKYSPDRTVKTNE